MTNLVATPQHLAAASQVLDDYCAAFPLRDPGSREQIGLLLLQFFRQGAAPDELRDKLEAHLRAKGHVWRADASPVKFVFPWGDLTGLAEVIEATQHDRTADVPEE